MFDSESGKMVDRAVAAECDHPVWVTHMRGGEPMHVQTCQLCGLINWDDLKEQWDARELQIQETLVALIQQMISEWSK